MKNSNDTTGNRTCDLPTCGAVPQPTAPPRAPIYIYIYIYIYTHTHTHTHTHSVPTWAKFNLCWTFRHVTTAQVGEDLYFVCMTVQLLSVCLQQHELRSFGRVRMQINTTQLPPSKARDIRLSINIRTTPDDNPVGYIHPLFYAFYVLTPVANLHHFLICVLLFSV